MARATNAARAGSGAAPSANSSWPRVGAATAQEIGAQLSLGLGRQLAQQQALGRVVAAAEDEDAGAARRMQGLGIE